jgi:DNA-directed RNA polymerase subunit N (RpoN/RPB10)
MKMSTIYKEVEIDLDNEELIGLVEDSTLDVDEVFDEASIADYCCRSMDIHEIYEYDTVLAHVVWLWTKTSDINDKEKVEFLTKIGAEICEK